MPQSLFLFYPPNASGPNNWKWSGVAVGNGNDQQLQAVVEKLDENTEVILFLPNEEVLLTSAEIPARQAAQIQKAAPFIIEEMLACDPAGLQVCTSRDQGSDKQAGMVHIAAVNKVYLQQCLQQLETLGVNPDRVFAESMSLPVPAADELLIYPQQDGRLLFRWAKNHGVSIDGNLLESWLPMLLSEQPKLGRILLDSSTLTDESLETKLKQISELEIISAPLILNSTNNYQHAVNLLSGDFRSVRNRISVTGWRWPLRLLAVALLLMVINAFIQYNNNQNRLQQLDSNIETTFRDTFPEIKRIEDPLIQARQQLGILATGSSDQASLIALLHEFTAAVKKYPGVKLQSFDYRSGKLEIRLQAANIEVLENLRAAIKQQGVEASLSSANLGQQGVDARLVLSRSADQ